MDTTEKQIRKVKTTWGTHPEVTKYKESWEIIGFHKRGENKNGEEEIFKEIMKIRDFPCTLHPDSPVTTSLHNPVKWSTAGRW